MTAYVTSTVSNIIEVNGAELEAAEEESGAVSEFVEAFEQQLSNVEVPEGEHLTFKEPNVAVQVSQWHRRVCTDSRLPNT